MAKQQTEIEGTERFHDDEISAAIEDLKHLRAKRADLKSKVDSTRDRLIEMLRSKGLEEYVDPELGAKVRVSDRAQLSLTEFKQREDGIDEAAE